MERDTHLADESMQAPDAPQARTAAAFLQSDVACAFGPSFFMGHLSRFVRDRCPDPKENLPMVQLRLVDGEVLDVCHIVGVSPRWVMFAVRDGIGHKDEMSLKLIPYDTIQRVSISTRRTEGASIGFSQTHAPEIIAPEMLLRAAMAPPRAPAAEGSPAPHS